MNLSSHITSNMEQSSAVFFSVNMIKKDVVWSSDQRPPFTVSRFLTLETGRESEVIDVSKRKKPSLAFIVRIKNLFISLIIRF